MNNYYSAVHPWLFIFALGAWQPCTTHSIVQKICEKLANNADISKVPANTLGGYIQYLGRVNMAGTKARS
jgi:hypothetical protein